MTAKPVGQKSENTAASAVEANNSERREQILATSWEVLSQVGFEKITTRRIAEAVGINIATLHYYFGSKEAVLTETLRYAQEWADERMREAVTGSKTAEEALERAFAHTRKMVLTGPGPLRFDLAVRAFRDAEAKQEALRVFGRYEAYVCEMIEWHVRTGGRLHAEFSPQTLAEYVVAMVDGIVLHFLVSGNDVVAKRCLKQVQSQVWQLMDLKQIVLDSEENGIETNVNTNTNEL